ncbi:MAG: ABC-type branched-subunit amino acid transport system substrate-binding protein [Glaciecola sp.]|jgi:ABC-type branched-subunit amino acid transport system substrate-binding protein
MRHMSIFRRSAAFVAAGALLATACGSDDTTSPEPGPSESSLPSDDGAMPSGDRLASDFGVTSDPCPDAVNAANGCIYLGVLSDITEGPFAALGVEIVAAQELFWARVNADGGIGGFDINITEYTRDNKYNTEEHVAQYRAIEPNILALAQSLGTPTTLAALSLMNQDNVITAPASWWSGNAFEPRILESGASYCLESMNGLDWASTIDNEFFDGEVTSVMAVHYPGDYGDDSANGVAAWAESNGVDFPSDNNVPTGPNAAVGNQDGPVGAIISIKPDVVVLAVGPLEAGEIIGKAAASGYTGRFLGASPTWNPALMGNPDLAAVLPIIYRNIAPWSSFGADTAAHDAMAAAVGDNLPSNDGFTAGWVWSYPMKAALEQAAADADLTRAGLVAAAAKMTVDYEGALPNRSGGDAPFRMNVIGQPNPDAPLGISTITDFFAGPTATAYTYDAPCSG